MLLLSIENIFSQKVYSKWYAFMSLRVNNIEIFIVLLKNNTIFYINHQGKTWNFGALLSYWNYS